MAAAIDPELLLRQTGWLRSLALELLGDAHRAEDVVQDACLTALQRPPRTGSEPGLRAWLARVVRRQVVSGERSEQRRGRRERDAARPELVPSAAESVARFDVQRRLFEAVIGLEALDREVVVLRYFEGLPPREIARRVGSSSSAVRSRLSRALEVLRARLDASCGSRRRWMLALAPVAASRKGWLVLPLAAAAAAVAWLGWSPPSSAPVSPLVVEGAAAEHEPIGVAPPLPAKPRREDAAAAVAHVSPVAASGGRVVDDRGRPLAGVAVSVAMERVRTRVRTGPDGRFAFALHGERAVLWVDDPGHASLRGCVAQPGDAEDEHVLVVAPPRAIDGRVVDGRGDAVANAEVEIVVLDSAFAGLSVPLDAMLAARRSGNGHDHYTLAEWPDAFASLVAASGAGTRTVRSGPDGRFELAGVPAVDDVTLVVRAPGFEPARQRLARGDRSATVALAGRSPQPQLRGTVVDDRGRPVAGAVVRWGTHEVRSQRGGGFAIRVPPSPAPLVAARPGWQPAVLRGLEEDLPKDGAPHVCLVLPGPALSIEARLRRADGTPCAGWSVKLLDGCVVDDTRLPVVLAEDLAAGRENVVSTRADGSFELSGLRPGRYRVWAWNPRDLQSFESRPLAAGERDAVLTVPPRKAGRVRGVVRAIDGTPLKSVDVSVALTVHDNGRGYRQSTTGRRVCTDARGEFDLGMVICGSTRLHVSGAGVLDHGQPLEEAGWYEPRVERQCRFRFEAQETAGDAISLLDAEGHRLRLYSTGFGSRFGDLRYPLARGRTPVLAASERACTLVILREGAEVGRWPVRLDPASIRVLTR